MTTTLTEIEIRVLGSLIEKQITTPEYYPLTLNSLTAACNQKNNRNPVSSFSESEVDEALYTLREKNLAYVFHGSTSRVPKYKHVAPEVMHLSPPEVAAMCVLMLSGPQTVGEIRTRGSRLYDFSGLEEVEETLRALAAREEEPLVMKLPRQSGQKDARFVHLLSGAPDIEAMSEAAPAERTTRRTTDNDRVATLEQQVEALTQQVAGLAEQFESFKKQFE
ncbi:MAG TPA: YceH family protein [Pyrinomonadaceae bacterium]|nr:YceH family protein [Pyrinomonadaceae bacterium]